MRYSCADGHAVSVISGQYYQISRADMACFCIELFEMPGLEDYKTVDRYNIFIG